MKLSIFKHVIISSALLAFSLPSADAAMQCNGCHGTSAPVDYRPLDEAGRNPATGGFQGNHRTHMEAPSAPSACDTCHPGSSAYISAHRDGKIKLSSRINNSPLITTYKNSTSAFNQSATPSLGSCGNVNCHFENVTPAWGSDPAATSCTTCHGAPPNGGSSGAAGSHARHVQYFPGTSNCLKCHANNTGFQHATSAGNRNLAISFAAAPNNGSGVYSGALNDYLPSQTNSFGNCTATYCHSPGTKSASFNPPNQIATWGGTLGCAGCHAATPATGSHSGHVSTTYGVPVACHKCHAATVTSGMTIYSTSKHVNKLVNIAFNSSTTAIFGKYSGHVTPMQKNPGSGYANCENVYCHSNGQNPGGTWPPTYSSPKWGAAATGECGTCHDHGYHGGVALISSGSHGRHMGYNFGADNVTRCGICHYGSAFATPSCSLCHFSSSALTDLHINHKVDVSFVTKFGGAYNGTPEPGDGYSSCANVYCHSNGTSVATASVPVNTSPAWGSGTMMCNGCHGNLSYSDSRKAFPLYTTGKPKANSHKAHITITCNKCHFNTTSDGVTITSTTNHVNKAYNVNSGDGASFTYTFNASGGSCSSISCHFNNSAQWGTTIACGGCHAVTAATLAGQGHFTHLSSAFGPRSTCDACHGSGAATGEQAGHGNGTINFADGNNLASTTSCDTCHSPGGTYNGVGNATYGARANWTLGVYSSGLLKGGKEKWCVSCHDESASVISGITAPNVAGKESEAYDFGTGWGYYKTGHGLPSSSTYPASGGITAGGGVECSGCHDYSTSHIDGLARTYDDGESTTLDPSYYRQGYRLKLVGAGEGTGATGREPMLVPAPVTTANSANNHRMCVICHNSGPFVDSGNMSTNLVTDGVNRHEYHLNNIGTGRRVSADWSNTAACSSDWTQCNSRMTCTSCHNVHGSTRLAMINDGKLIAREPGLKYWNYSSGLVTFSSPPDTEPTPVSLPLTASSGTVWSGGSSSNLCSHCHGNTWLTTESRTPFQNVQIAPTLSWAGTTGYESDGVNPDTANGGSSFTFRVKYADGNNDAPSVYQVWVDINDNGIYDPGEKFDMSALDAGDTKYFDGKIYTLSMPLYKQGDNTYNYRFYFKDAASDAAGAPASENQVTVTNSAPALSWTGESNYLTDGVDPNTGGNGWSFNFRVKYTDTDNEAPDADGVRVLINGTYYTLDPEAGGSYSTGKIYSKGITLSTPGDLNYRFVAKDPAGVSATGDPASDHVVTVLVSSNNPPLLSWTTASCLTEGVRPRIGAINGDFEFRATYSDADNECPTYVRVTVNGTPYDLTDNDAASCQTGRTYYRTIPLAAAGDLNYSFSASDGADAATGTPTSSHTVSVLNTTFKVRPTGGAGWYSTIASAITASTDPSTILVYPNADFTAYTYPEGGISFSSKPNRTLQAVCGRDLTTISGGANTVAISSTNVVVDGFSISGGSSYGVYFNGGNAISSTVKNSKIYSNPTGVYLNLNSTVTIEDSLIQNNSTRGINMALSSSFLKIYRSNISDNNPSAAAVTGAGISFNGGSGIHVVEDCIIENNKSTGNGGGMYIITGSQINISGSTINSNSGSNGGAIFSNSGSPTLTISDTLFQGNSVTGNGGGLYVNTGTATLANVVLTGNKSALNGGAIWTNSTSGPPAVDCLYCTISGNYANAGGGIYRNAGTVAIKNSIVYGNDAATQPNYKQIFANSSGWQNVDVYNTLINQIPGSAAYVNGYESLGGNLNEGTRAAEIPNFVDPGNPADAPTAAGNHGNYHLQSDSYCIDAGGNYPASPNKDIDGQDRPYDVSGKGDGVDDYDMGADEYVP